MSHEREARKRADRARARQQMGSLYARRARPEAVTVFEGVCSCGEVCRSVVEVLLCEHKAKVEG